MKTTISILALALLALLGGSAPAATTNIAQVPLLNISGSGTIKPNLMLLFDNSGSMAWNFTPDYIDDSTTCRTGATMASGQTSCRIGYPPFSSPDFNKQYYNPNVYYRPPVKADGSSYLSLTSANTSSWGSVTTDGFGINYNDLTSTASSSTTVTSSNLVSGFPDYKWCNPSNSSSCAFNSATYTYPNATFTQPNRIFSNPYYYTINVAEYCADANLTNCQGTAVGAPAPAGYPFPARVRWCNSSNLGTCQAKYTPSFKYPRYSNPNGGLVAAYGTITIGASTTPNSISINSVSVTEPGGPVVITNGAVTAPAGTNTLTKQAAAADALASSIIAKSGLTNQYTACVKTPVSGSTVPDCALSYGITLGSTNMVAVIPIDCATGSSGKSTSVCSVLADNTRAGWAVTVNAPVGIVLAAQPSTAILGVAGTTSSQTGPVLSALNLGGTSLFPASPVSATTLTFGTSQGAATVAAAIAAKINATGVSGITASVGGGTSPVTACLNAGSAAVCIFNSAANAAGKTIGVGSLSSNAGAGGSNKNGSIVFSTAAATTPTAAVTDGIPVTATPLGAGNAVFVRVDIVSTRNSYPRSPNRIDCAGASCTYIEEMTNFANWYGYYKTRMQMMKTSVGQAFQPLTSNYKVGIVALSVAGNGGTMNYLPQPFSGTPRATWYSALYAMSVSGSTPMRKALHAVGQMYANTTNGVVQFPCQQNFTFITTDGFWNDAAAPG
ncbi:MAG TPA: hypothetical protein VFG03_14130, partial [Telluria sp.]|nr:hypothetical protein [Telluria sp.]